MLAYEKAGSGNIGPLIFTLLDTGRERELVEFIEDRWSNLDDLEADYPAGDSGYGLMSAVAQAYSRQGNEERFLDAMQRVRRALDQAISLGTKAAFFYVQEAEYQALTGNHDAALDNLERAMEGGFTTTRLAEDWQSLKALEGDARYHEILARMTEHLQSERAALGLEPVST